ncbi:hypothetical protein, partial [Duganella aceris]|uniref:hypothetical protein n=1 Tax=Duganella aceris TaxID=2703883 RepID=UPI001A955C37
CASTSLTASARNSGVYVVDFMFSLPLTSLSNGSVRKSQATSEKLIVREDAYFQAESGIRISNSAGEEIIICNAATPCEVTMEAPFFHDKFKPEYDIGKYEFFAAYGE